MKPATFKKLCWAVIIVGAPAMLIFAVLLIPVALYVSALHVVLGGDDPSVENRRRFINEKRK